MRISDWSSDVCSFRSPITPDVDSLLKQFAQSSQLGSNAAYIEDLYEQYLVAPDSVGPQWKAWFDGFKGREAGDIPHSAIMENVAAAGRQATRGVVAHAAGERRESHVGRRIPGSEQRRDGQGCVSTCKLRRSHTH